MIHNKAILQSSQHSKLSILISNKSCAEYNDHDIYTHVYGIMIMKYILSITFHFFCMSL